MNKNIFILSIIASIAFGTNSTSQARICAEKTIGICRTGQDFPESQKKFNFDESETILDSLLNRAPEYESVCRQKFPDLKLEIAKLLPQKSKPCVEIIEEITQQIVEWTRDQVEAPLDQQMVIRYYMAQDLAEVNKRCGRL